MKVFNLCIRVTLSQLFEIPDTPPEDKPKEPFNDDPLHKADQLFQRAEKLLAGGPVRAVGVFGEQDGQTIVENVRIVADSFEEQQAILAKFHAIAKSLPAVPDSLLPTATAGF